MTAMQVLLLNNNFQPLGFISEIRAINFILKDKVEVLSNWDEILVFASGNIQIPSVLKLNYLVRPKAKKIVFSRNAVFRRDQYLCQFCSMALVRPTLEHLHPQSRGGISSFLNCVTACSPCNQFKADRTLEEAGMTLVSHPHVPTSLNIFLKIPVYQHTDWAFYLSKK